jgi:predicted AlkP superfamily phosphohydrolase/phosphomutase
MDALNSILLATKREIIKMRKFMTKEVTVTMVKVATIGIDENGLPSVTDIETVELLGELTKEKATKKYNKAGGTKTVFNVTTETRTYKMEVSEFIKVATLVTGEDESLEEEDEEEAE